MSLTQEIECRDLFQKLLGGINHCHENQVAHRDLKLENITIFGLKGKVKIIDFGFSLITPKHRKIAVGPVNGRTSVEL